jgi:uncharacterized Zn-finger protein
MKSKWKKTEAGGYNFSDVDANIWCPCDIEMKNTIYCQGGNEAICPNCGKVYRVIVRISVQEKIA